MSIGGQAVVQGKLRADIEAAGFGLNTGYGGIKKLRYYTPDGRVIITTPQIRDYVKKNAAGQVVESGQRDANLDKGWLLQSPAEKKLFCRHCDRWHDTEVEIQACGIQQAKRFERAARQAGDEETAKTKSLEEKVLQLEALVNRLMKEKGIG